jgi:hypothetical protein
MTDVAAGGQAALQLQQSMAAAPYVQQQASAAAEETQLKLQQDRLKALYAPQEAAAKAEQEQLRLKTERLRELAAETGYTADKESTQKLQQWMQSDEGKKASESDVIKKSAIFKLQAGLTEEGTKLMTQADKLDALDLANKAKKLAADDEAITKASVTLEAVPEGKEDEFISRLPADSIKAAEERVGKDNWAAFTGAEKKQVLSRLMLNTKTLVAEQTRAVNLEKAKLLVASREKISTYHEDESTRRKEMEGDVKYETTQLLVEGRKNVANITAEGKKEVEAMIVSGRKSLEKMKEDYKKDNPKDDTSKDFRGWSAYTRERNAVIKDSQKEEKALDDKIVKADAKVVQAKSASWYNVSAPDLEKATLEYNDLVSKRDVVRTNRAKKELDLVLSMPEFPSKEKIVADLQKQLKILPEEKETPKNAKDVSAAAVKPAATSNKPAAQKFEEGKVYTDAKGNTAKYVNGKWEPQ